jgi:hypothetical protein
VEGWVVDISSCECDFALRCMHSLRRFGLGWIFLE